MGKALTLKIISQDGEMKIKLREKSTINNLKLIIANKWASSRENIKLLKNNKEPARHERLIDIGLVDGSILEARVENAGGQELDAKVIKEDILGEE